MDMKQLLALVSEKVETDHQQDETCGVPMNMPAQQEPPKQPVTMTVNMNASGSDQIKELLKLISGAEAQSTEMPVKIAMAPDEDFANSPDEKYGDLSTVIASGDDLHKAKKAYKAAQPGDNAMAVESLKQELAARYRQIKES
jgi:hypothetical protein